MPKQRRHRVRTTRPSGGAVATAPAAQAPRDTGPTRITSADEAARLAAHLLDPDRRRPVVVVSIPSGAREPWIDAAAIDAAVRGLADVVVLPTDESSWALSHALPAMTQVYGGAGRVYPPDLGWTANPYRSPLRFAYHAGEGEAATDLLISDALSMAQQAGVVPAAHVTATPAAGVVRMTVPPSRAVVALDDGGLATIWQELTLDGVDIDRLVAPGMRVTGLLDPESHRLDVTGMTSGAERPAYGVGDVVLARVVDVRPDVVRLALTPDAVTAVPRDRVTDNDADRLTSLFSPGEVVVARVAWVTEKGPALRLDDVDDDEEPLPAPALLAGGPPWLEPPVYDHPAEPFEPAGEGAAGGVVPVVPSPHPAPVAPVPPAPAPATRTLSLSLDSARAEIRRLEDELARLPALDREVTDLRARLRGLEEDYRHLHADHQRLRTQLRRRTTGRSSARPAATPDDVGPWFTDPVEQLRFEIDLAWARRIPAADKAALPLREYAVGPEFLPSLDGLEGVSRAKVVDVVVEVLTGLAEQLHSRQLHELRSGRGGGDPQLRREDGFAAWRAALQVNTPSARRLHYWRRGNEYELWRVCVHDDV